MGDSSGQTNCDPSLKNKLIGVDRTAERQTARNLVVYNQAMTATERGVSGEMPLDGGTRDAFGSALLDSFTFATFCQIV